MQMFRSFYLKHKEYYKRNYLEVGLYPQVVMIRNFILNTKVTKEAMGEDKDQTNEIEMNTQNESINYMNSALVK